jgi:NAD(P)-dependent dehydrogenase (short-subunit alcohol dehydrogenase family)
MSTETNAKNNSETIALVTGAGRGIGLEVARQLAQAEMTIILGVRDAAKGEEAARELVEKGLKIVVRTLDIASEESVTALAKWVEEEFGKLDILVNNAAGYVNWMETASTADLAASHQLFETNLFGTWRITQAMLPLVRKSSRGRIVFVSSGAGSHGDKDFGLTTGKGSVASYGVSKAAINALMAKFAAELEGSGILVNAVCPGLTATAPGMEAMGARPIPEGAKSIVWAALLPDDGPSGGFFRDGKPLPW